MINKTLIEGLVNQVSSKIGELDNTMNAKNTIKALLTQQLSKLDLVSRDEFDAQQAVLLRTREKLEALEKQLEYLENKTSNNNSI